MIRVLLLAAGFLSAASAQLVDPKVLVTQSIANYNHDWREAMSWAYTQTDVSHDAGGLKTEVFEIAPLEGTPYDRLILRNGQPLDSDEQRKEERKYEKIARERSAESPGERAERIQKYEKAREFVNEVPNAYNFKLLGSENVNGRPAWVVQLTPRADFESEIPHASILRHIEGKLWIDKEDVRWAKAEAPVMDKISIGVILARIGPGTSFEVEQVRIADDLWLPQEIRIKGMARVLLFHEKNLGEELTFANYHKESSSSASSQQPMKPVGSKSFR